MTAASDHFKHAEMLADMASADEIGSDQERFHLAKGQLHATLALAREAADIRAHLAEIRDEIAGGLPS